MTKTAYIALALGLCAITAPALADDSSNAHVLRVDDIDLASVEGRAALDARIASVIRRMCSAEGRTGTRIPDAACARAVRDEALAKLDAYRKRVGAGG